MAWYGGKWRGGVDMDQDVDNPLPPPPLFEWHLRDPPPLTPSPLQKLASSSHLFGGFPEGCWVTLEYGVGVRMGWDVGVGGCPKS